MTRRQPGEEDPGGSLGSAFGKGRELQEASGSDAGAESRRQLGHVTLGERTFQAGCVGTRKEASGWSE